MQDFNSYTWIFLIAFIIVILLLSILGKFVSLWFQAFVSGTPISMYNIVGMSLRKIPPRIIVNAYINAYKAGLKNISVADLETHFLAGGRVLDVILAMIASDKANISLSWKQATAIDLAGRDILEAVRTSVNPKVIDCPDKSGMFISAIAKNGVELLCKARVTVRTNLEQLVGGAKEETVVARVGEGIVNAIGSSETHFDVLEAPQRISKLVLDKGLDVGTAFEILSIDISDINVGKNIGAQLKTDQAEADKKIAQAKAEQRRAMAVALEQENIAKVQEMKAKVIEAEAQVPLAIAEAFKTGRIGVMDYMKIKNIEADTNMRNDIIKSSEQNKNDEEKQK